MSSSPPEIEARKLSLPKPLHTPSPQISAFLYDPISTSLALRHSDSSFSLYPSFSPLSISFFPPPKSLIPSATSSAAFLHLRTAANPDATLFVTTSPLLRPSPSTLLCFYILRDGRFVRIKVVCKHRDLEFDRGKYGVVFKVNHGVSVRLSGGVNVLALYSVSNSKIWVFAVRLIGDEGGGEALKLMKCGVIDCVLPVFSIRVLFGFLVVGEENGVRVFPLQLLVKGNQKKDKKNSGKRCNLKNGSSNGIDVAKASNGGKSVGTDGDLNLLPAKVEKCSDSVKLRSVKLRQDSKDVGAFFVAFEDRNVESSISITMAGTGRSVKAISVQALSANYFLVLDSLGDVHFLNLSYSVQGLDNPCIMKRLTQTMKVVDLAVFHDMSAVTKTIWMSDGCHTVHLMVVSNMDASFEKTEKKDTIEKLIQTSVTQTIFSSEKIQEIVPLATNAVLILGQGRAVLWNWINGLCHLTCFLHGIFAGKSIHASYCASVKELSAFKNYEGYHLMAIGAKDQVYYSTSHIHCMGRLVSRDMGLTEVHLHGLRTIPHPKLISCLGTKLKIWLKSNAEFSIATANEWAAVPLQPVEAYSRYLNVLILYHEDDLVGNSLV